VTGRRLLSFLPRIAGLLAWIDPNPVRALADFHTLFNVLTAIAVFLPR